MCSVAARRLVHKPWLLTVHRCPAAEFQPNIPIAKGLGLERLSPIPPCVGYITSADLGTAEQI